MSDKQVKPIDDHTAYILFLATIDAHSVEQLFDTISNDLPDHTKAIYLLIATNGGSVSHGIALYNLLRGLPYKVIIHNIANMDSIGNTIMMGGTKRYATSNARFLIHRVKSTLETGKVSSDDVKEKLSNIETDEQRVTDILKKHTKLTQDEIDKFFKSGRSVDAQYALEKNIIDEIKDISIPQGTQLRVIKAS